MPITNRDIEEAKAYLRSRVDAENSMTYNLERLMKEAARRMVNIAYRYKIPPSQFRFSANSYLQLEINDVVRWLKDRIEETTLRLAVAYEKKPEDGDRIIAYVSARSHGKTFRQRTDVYCNRFKYEVESAIAAGLLLGVAKEKLKQSIYDNLTHPYSSPIFKEAIGEKSIATRLVSKGITYGVGRPKSMRNALDSLTTHAVSQGWMRHWLNVHDVASGFYAYRGSSYPCQLCDSKTGWHPIEDYTGGWHLRCRCYFVFT